MAKFPATPVYATTGQTSMPLSPCAKLQESIIRLPPTPPDTFDKLDKAVEEDLIPSALHVIATERDSLTHLHQLYRSNAIAQQGFKTSVNSISQSVARGGRLVVCGVGKSGKIGLKVVASMNSFGIRSIFLHPTEALHGDLGMIGPNDTMLVITYSGKTPELLALLPYIPSDLPVIALTSHIHPSACPLLNGRSSNFSILLPAPIPISEVQSFGVPAPTTSTTTALTLADALALTISRHLHQEPAAIFHCYHPGGAIGANACASGPKLIAEVAIDAESVPIVSFLPDRNVATILDVLLTATRSTSGWVRPSSTTIISPRQIQRIGNLPDLHAPLQSLGNDVVVEKPDWISIPAANTVDEAREWILGMRKTERGKTFLKLGTVLGIVDAHQCVSGVVEIEDIVDEMELRDYIGSIP